MGDARGLTAGRLGHELRRGGRPRPYGRSACTVQAQRRKAWGEPPQDAASTTGPRLPPIRRGEVRWGNPRGGYWIFRGPPSGEWLRPARGGGGANRTRGVERFAPGGWSDSLQWVERFAPVPVPIASGHFRKISHLTAYLSFSARLAGNGTRFAMNFLAGGCARFTRTTPEASKPVRHSTAKRKEAGKCS